MHNKFEQNYSLLKQIVRVYKSEQFQEVEKANTRNFV